MADYRVNLSLTIFLKISLKILIFLPFKHSCQTSKRIDFFRFVDNFHDTICIQRTREFAQSDSTNFFFYTHEI